MSTFKKISMFGLLLGLSLALGMVHCKKKPAGGKSTDKTAPKAADFDVAKAKKLYTTNGCQTCHGDTGMGDGAAGKSLNPKPRNFKDLKGYKQGTSENDVFKTLTDGVDGGKTGMVGYKHVPEADRRILAKYVVSLQK